MPNFTLKAKCLKTNARKHLNVLLLVTCYLLLVTFLSGCSLIGTSKPAALQVTSKPGASVFLDGKHLGKTPFFSDQLKAGEHTIKITESEASYVEKINLTQGTLTVVNRELANNSLAQSGEVLWLETNNKGLFIASIPDEADITLDGRLLGKTPLLTEDIKDGEHKVLISKVGYLDHEFSIKTSGKYRLVANVTLASEIAKSSGPAASPQPSPAPKKVTILKTPQGFLRVRREPALNAPEVGRVNTGDELEVIQETDDWIKVSFAGPSGSEADKQGWISSQYTKKLP